MARIPKTPRPRSARAATATSAKRPARKSVPQSNTSSVKDAPKVSSADQIGEAIVRSLYDGRYVAGQKLTESDLTREFGVGRGTLREALRRLAAEGLVTLSLYRGASIRSLTRNDVRDILEVIEALSSLSARLAAERISKPAERRTLQDTMASLSKLAKAGDSFEFARMRDRFYRQLAEISGNRELNRLLSLVQAHLIRVQFRTAYGPSPEKHRLDDYQRIVKAILDGDGARAESAMRQHIRATAKAIQGLPDNSFAVI